MSDTYSPPTTKAELYERIRKTSKQEVILQEMIRLGYWPADQPLPGDSPQERQHLEQLEKELLAVRTELSRLKDEEALRRAIRKRRLEESRRKKKETKARREQNRKLRAEQWQGAKKLDIKYLGPGVSAGLQHQGSDQIRLKQYQIPVLKTAAEIAAAMNISVGELRFLAFARKTSKCSHYKRFTIPKKSGGQRLISAPMPRLKQAQLWILENILDKIPVHESAHGFLKGRSIVSNADPHVGAAVLINLDLKDFFPTVTYPRVKGLFRSLGYSEQVATILGLLCTEPEVDEVLCNGETYYVTKSARHLPQGAPSSPMITNLICRRLDKRLLKTSQELGFTYTRYADDLSFSGSGNVDREIGKLIRTVNNIIKHEGFLVHPAKTRILRTGRKQEVTGIVVNHKRAVDRKNLRRLRATLFQIEKDGLQGKSWRNSKNVIESIQGYANFVSMVDVEKGLALKQKIEKIKEKTGFVQPKYKRYPKKVPSWIQKNIEKTAREQATAHPGKAAESAAAPQPPKYSKGSSFLQRMKSFFDKKK
ncbi:reverse transcriptase domain-containing protein [candidate division CSSED10-310 bacterium]|uniref:RNA-directed DNA polymerase n=1 Tax=candidate division CSSED10-310 bacterium TaxID=2855610 RepID=A0ABV6YS71_UNCC1